MLTKCAHTLTLSPKRLVAELSWSNQSVDKKKLFKRRFNSNELQSADRRVGRVMVVGTGGGWFISAHVG